MKRKELARHYRIADDPKFRLKDHDPADTWKMDSKETAEEWLHEGTARLGELQDLLYAQNQWSLLLVFQAMDAAGKDGTIKHVMSGINPEGCGVCSFKSPSSEELSHDYLWRTAKATPERGHIGIFNRSYYEEVLVVRVHPNYLERQRLPAPLITDNIWKERFQDINGFERHLARNGTVIRKFFLHVSRKEQRARLLERLQNADKNWKFSPDDIKERQSWDNYMDAYEEMIRHTATDHAPWYVVPADNKWFTRLVVAEVVVQALESLDLRYPVVSPEKKKELAAIRAGLEAKKIR